MAILKQIKQIVKKNKSDDGLAELVEEFYQEALPHKQQYITKDMTPKVISEKLDLCQVCVFQCVGVGGRVSFTEEDLFQHYYICVIRTPMKSSIRRSSPDVFCCSYFVVHYKSFVGVSFHVFINISHFQIYRSIVKIAITQNITE